MRSPAEVLRALLVEKELVQGYTVERLDLEHLRDGADHRPLVAPSRLPAVGDQRLSELRFAVLAQAVANHVAVAGLEHVEREDAPGDEHAVGQRKDGQLL